LPRNGALHFIRHLPPNSFKLGHAPQALGKGCRGWSPKESGRAIQNAA